MKRIIIYESKNGATREYAQWLSETTGIPCLPRAKAGRLEDYDQVILGSCVRAFSLTMGNWIKSRWNRLKDRKPVLFSVAGAPADSPKRQEFVLNSLDPAILANLPHFPLDGRMDFARMGAMDRFIMKLGIKMVGKKDPAQAQAMAMEFDHVKRENLKALVEYLGLAGVKA